jgi:hypothetical protein
MVESLEDIIIKPLTPLNLTRISLPTWLPVKLKNIAIHKDNL